MQIFDAIEWSPTDIPIEHVMKDGKFNIYTDVQQKGYFNILFRRSSLVLTAGEYIGLIPLNDEVAINVHPKVPLSNLMHLIHKSGERVIDIDYERMYGELLYSSAGIFDFIIRSFLQDLQNIDKFGVYRKYETMFHNDGLLKGKILFKETMRNVMRHQDHIIAHSFFLLDKDIPENRAIKYALWTILNHFRDLNYKPRNLVRKAIYFYRFFEQVKLDRDKKFLVDVKDILETSQVPFIRSYYNAILRISLLIINQSSIDVQRFEQDIYLPSLIIKMSDVFEKYLFRVLKEGIQRKNVKVLNGNKAEGMKKLFSDNQMYTTTPDIVIKKEKIFPLIIDAKYKDQPRREDLNQIITYCLSYRSNVGVLICPKTSVLSGEEYIGQISGVRIFTYHFNLANKDIRAEEQTLLGYIEDKFLTDSTTAER
ncbi:MAG: McrC family protein [Candidatus Bathyarchaeota archaeon]|nr:McrC family protein [Candidatus Bathyarchaeota archaeon]